MKQAILCLTAALLLAATGSGLSWAKPQENCPVMGGKINKSLYADYDGKRVYFCCTACPEPFKKDPEKYIKIMETEGVEFEKVHGAKPVPVPMPAQKAE
jgi:YHS domain-containing protein